MTEKVEVDRADLELLWRCLDGPQSYHGLHVRAAWDRVAKLLERAPRWMHNPRSVDPDARHRESGGCAERGCVPWDQSSNRAVVSMPDARPVRVLPGVTVAPHIAERWNLPGEDGDDAA